MTESSRSFAPGVKRRRLIQAILSLPLVSLWARPAAPTDIAQALRGVFSRPASARAVGRAVLRHWAGPSALPDLLAELQKARPELCRACAAASRDQLTALLRDARRDDFARGRTLIVDGWILGRTEALVCALVAAA
jgi:hypothetical protein